MLGVGRGMGRWKMPVAPRESSLVAQQSKPAGSAETAGDTGLIPGWGKAPREGNGNPLQYSCQENPVDRGAWQATVHAKRRTRLKQVS